MADLVVPADWAPPTALRPAHISAEQWTRGVLQVCEARYPDWHVFPHQDGPHKDGWIAYHDGGHEIQAPNTHRLELLIHAANRDIAAQRDRAELRLLGRPCLDHSP